MSESVSEDAATEPRTSSQLESLPEEEPQQRYSVATSWCVLVLLLLLMSAGRIYFSSTARDRDPQVSPTYIVDINRAVLPELQALPEVGVALAQRIVSFRAEHGNFPDVDSLQQVRGVGVTTLKHLQPMLVVGVEETTSSRQRTAPSSRASEAQKGPHVD